MKKVLIVIGILGTLAMTSCKKEGCLDANATNYDIKAKKSDGTCTYTSSVAFWFNQATSDWLVAEGTTKIYIEIDDVQKLDMLVTEFDSIEPNCESGDVIFQRLTYDLGGSYAQSYPLKVKDDNGDVIWVSSVVFTGGSCDNYQLTH